jgi:E3 ubiquitin-protein ligase DOA10
MGLKHVKFEVLQVEHKSSLNFVCARKNNEKNEFRRIKESEESDDSSQYPKSSSSVLYEDSDDEPVKKVRIKKIRAKSVKHRKDFREKIREFEKSEFTAARRFTEHHARFHAATIDTNVNEWFKEKVKKFERNESRVCLLRNNTQGATLKDKKKSKSLASFRKKTFNI